MDLLLMALGVAGVLLVILIFGGMGPRRLQMWRCSKCQHWNNWWYKECQTIGIGINGEVACNGEQSDATERLWDY